MKCSACEEMIVSVLLAEVSSFSCPHCQETVPVNDVMIFAEGFTFHRNDLVKRLFRYKKLLSEVSKEREMLEASSDTSDESKKSLDRFLQALEEVLAGARNNLRLDFVEQIPVRFSFGSQVQSGMMSNLSLTGACIEIACDTPHPRRNGAVSLTFSIPELLVEQSLPAVVSWVDNSNTGKRKGCAIGIKFKSLNQDVLDRLWDFISRAATADAEN